VLRVPQTAVMREVQVLAYMRGPGVLVLLHVTPKIEGVLFIGRGPSQVLPMPGTAMEGPQGSLAFCRGFMERAEERWVVRDKMVVMRGRMGRWGSMSRR